MTAMNRPSSTFPNHLHTNENKTVYTCIVNAPHRIAKRRHQYSQSQIHSSTATTTTTTTTTTTAADRQRARRNDCVQHTHLVTHRTANLKEALKTRQPVIIVITHEKKRFRLYVCFIYTLLIYIYIYIYMICRPVRRYIFYKYFLSRCI